jgi:hypothetical protein
MELVNLLQDLHKTLREEINFAVRIIGLIVQNV